MKKLCLQTAAVMFLLASGASSYAQNGDVSSGLIQRTGIAYSRVTGKVYVVDGPNNALLMIAPDGTVKSVKTGSSPLAIAVNDLTGTVYVANSGSRSVTIVDGTKGEVIATVSTAATPYAIATNESANKVYVSNTFSNMLTVIDGKTNSATNIKTGSADALMMDAKRNQLYLLGYESNALSVFDPETREITKLPAGATHLWGVAELGKTLYVTHIQDASMAAIDTETHTIVKIATGAIPCALAIDSVAGKVYVANYGDGSVTLVDTRNNSVTATVKVGGHPQAIAVDEVRGFIYVAETRENLVSVIDAHTLHVAKQLKAEHPYAVVMNTVTRKVYAANMGAKAFTEISFP